MLTLREGEKLQVILAAAANATELPLTAEYDDTPNDRHRGSTKTADGITTGDTAVDLVTGLASGRRITGFSAHNADDTSVTITVRFYNKDGTTRILYKSSLLTGESLYWSEAKGWHAVDANGNLRMSSSGTSSASSEALSAGTSAGTRSSVALSTATSQATSLSVVGSTTLSTATSQNTSQSVNISVVKSTADSG